MTSIISCNFCTQLGISPPHNHTVRDYKLSNKPITCPNLLNINCTYCKQKGHTKNYCSILNKKNSECPSPINFNLKRKSTIDTIDNSNNKCIKKNYNTDYDIMSDD